MVWHPVLKSARRLWAQRITLHRLDTKRQNTTRHDTITRPGSGTCMLRVSARSAEAGEPGSANPRPTRAPEDLSPDCARTVAAGACRVQVLALLLREPILPPDCANAAATSGLARVDRQRRQGSIGAASPRVRVSPEERDRRIPARDLDLPGLTR
ncbi:hypothetical protein TgHK011_005193 [Trichoderma gracile]|nr:hypothetical protein TgHK011_005193 [Trichoderma gracile]